MFFASLNLHFLKFFLTIPLSPWDLFMPAAKPPQTLLGSRLRQCREEKGWSQAQLGQKLGWEPNTAAPRISRYERGIHEADLQTLTKLSHLLDIPMACLFLDTEQDVEIFKLVLPLSEAEKISIKSIIDSWITMRSLPLPEQSKKIKQTGKNILSHERICNHKSPKASIK